MILFLVQLISILSQFIVLLVIVSVILSYFMSPYHPVRRAIDQLVEPMLNPIRRIMPNIGMFDFSPLVLIILVQLLSSVLINVISSVR